MRPFFRIGFFTLAEVASAALTFAQDAPPPPIAEAPADYFAPTHEGPELIAARFQMLGFPGSGILARNAQSPVEKETVKEIPVKALPEAVPPAPAQPETARPAAAPQIAPVDLVVRLRLVTSIEQGPSASPAEREMAAPPASSLVPTKVRHPGLVRQRAAKLGSRLTSWGNKTWIEVDSPQYSVNRVAPAYVAARPVAVQQERAALPSPQAPAK